MMTNVTGKFKIGLVHYRFKLALENVSFCFFCFAVSLLPGESRCIKDCVTVVKIESFEASNRGQFSCRCTLDQWLDLIGVISS